MSATGATPGLPAVEVVAEWAAYRQLVVDLATGGAVAGLLVGFLGGRPGWGVLGIAAGAALGALAGRWLGPRRHRLRLDPSGVHIGRLTSTRSIPWAEVRAFGVTESWAGRRGRRIGLAVCRAGVDLPIAVPALTFREPGWGRIGGEGLRPEEVVETHRPRLLEPVRAWAEARQVPTVATDVDSWWEIHQG